MLKYNVLNRFTGSVQFTAEIDCSEPDGVARKLGASVLWAIKNGANLDGANLDGAYLVGANLAVANLAGANLAGANLVGANLAVANLARAYLARAYLAGANLAGACLAGANLDGANLAGANLDGAYLAGANLDGAYLAGNKIVGDRSIVQVGPIGSRASYFVGYRTDNGLFFKAGCFFGNEEQFLKKLSEEHGENNHAKEYLASIGYMKKHFEIWT